MQTHSYEHVRITRDDARWEIEVKAEIPWDILLSYRTRVMKDVSHDADIAGFRIGHAPQEVVLKHYGEAALLERAASSAVRDILPEILAQEQANIVAAPTVAIEPMAPEKSVLFTARAPLAPQIKLPDYKRIAMSVNTANIAHVVSDEEYAQALDHFRRERARIEALEGGKNPREAAEYAQALAERDLPEIDDDFARSVGYDDANSFAQAVRAAIKKEKDIREMEKRRAAMLDMLVKQAEIKYPSILREYELDEMEARMAGDLERMNTTLDAFLAQSKKTKHDLRAEWEQAADQRARVRLLLGEIARVEHIEPDPAALASQLEQAKKHYKNADEDILRAHLSHAMRNEAVIRFLEGGARAEQETNTQQDTC